MKCARVILKKCTNYNNKEAFKILREIENKTLKAMNNAMREYYLWEVQKWQYKDENEIFPDEKEMFGKSYRNVVEGTMKSIMDICNTSNVSQTNAFVFAKWNNIKKDVLFNKVNIVNYKSGNPIHIKNTSYVIEPTEEGFSVHLRLFNMPYQKQHDTKELVFKMDKIDKSKKSILINLISKTYKQGAGQLKFDKKGKLELLISYEPVEKTIEHIPNRTLGVDLGMVFPAYASLNDTPYVRKGFGSYDAFTRKRTQFQERKRNLYKELKLNIGGKGRENKLKALDKFRSYESNFAKTYNHNISSEIIKFAKDNKCQYINLEKLDKEGLDARVLRNWSYYQLQEFIQYKAKEVGITVRFVDCKFTSQTCSQCGFVDADNRKTQDTFLCLECGYKSNADYNASQNIANSEKYIK